MRFHYHLLSITTLAFALALSGCSKEDHKDEKQAISLSSSPVSVKQVETVPAINQTEVVGTVQAVEKAEISSKITGNITVLTVDLGSSVARGDLIVELSAGEISAQVQQAKAQYEQAIRNLTREENLLKKQAATQESVKSYTDQKKIAEAAYNEARTMLEYTRITAPFAGIVTRKSASIGDLATPGKVLMHIEKQGALEVQTAIPEAMILKIHKGDTLPVYVPSTDQRLTGSVAEVSPTADPASRTAPIKLHLEPNPNLRSGQFARITLAIGEAQTIMVPESAIVLFGQMRKAFVVEDNRARLRFVKTGIVQDGNVEVLSGLEPGETVVVAGNEKLVDGQPVTIE
jgi:RND family efflux transporter MFP subunit